MTSERTWLVGGLSSVHDPLLAAALRGAGFRAVAVHPRTDSGLRRARSLGNHGQCNPAHYAVGAVLEHARRSGEDPAAFADRHGWLTAGSCGPCRLAAFGFEYARVLAGAGLERLPVAQIEPLVFMTGRVRAGLPCIGPQAANALLLAVVAGDVLTTLGHALRPYAVDPCDVDSLLESGVGDVAEALERRASLVAPLRRLRAGADMVARVVARALPRVLLVGEPWMTLADGDPSYDLARRLGAHGVEVDAPMACDWLHYRIWEEEREAGAEPGGPEMGARIRTLRRADRRIRALWRFLAAAVRLGRARRPDMNELATLAGSHYDPDVRGGSAHLEVGRALQADRDRTAHLVLSLKPFGCIPSSHVSDGILSVVLRRGRRLPFLALETCGDADATAESRVEMAIHAAALAAADDFAVVCRERAMTPAAARRELEARSSRTIAVDGPRTYACSSAESLWRARAQP
jgi:predicted nucleotide-binding protein (sugar kinase/HSP70/actin superfamily)